MGDVAIPQSVRRDVVHIDGHDVTVHLLDNGQVVIEHTEEFVRLMQSWLLDKVPFQS